MKSTRIIISLTLIVSMVLVLCSCTPKSGNNPDATSADMIESTVADGNASEEVTAEITTVEETTKEENTMPITLKIGSYNIKHGADANLDLSIIGNVIKTNGLDIVGIQEVDFKTKRSNGMDQPKLLSMYADMPYYIFVPAINYQGGQYGTLILSKYPIISSEVIPLESATYEKRALGHAKIDVNGRVVDFFNTHLSYEDTTTRSYQFYAVSEKLIECKDFILTGDFNTSDFSEFLILGGNLLNNISRSYPTFPGSSKPIDNIVFSDSFKEISSGTVTKSYSDHYMLWAEFTLN